MKKLQNVETGESQILKEEIPLAISENFGFYFGKLNLLQNGIGTHLNKQFHFQVIYKVHFMKSFDWLK
jgi:hypothetical protein